MDKEEFKTNVVRQLVFRRLQKGLSQKDVAEALGTRDSNISRIESGRQNISLDTLYRYCNAVECEPVMVMEDIQESFGYSNEYSLRLFDDELMRFTMEYDAEARVEVLRVNESLRQLFPVGLKPEPGSLLKWLRRRSIPSNRQFAGSILSAFDLDINNIKGIIDLCKGLSLNDSYWVAPADFEGVFEDFNLFDNDFSEILSLIAYTGAPYSPGKMSISPEFTTGGMLRKAWRRKGNGEIWLYKGGSEGFANAGNEPYSEFYASQIAERMGLLHVSYSLENWKGILASKCSLFCSKDVSFVSAGALMEEADSSGSGGIEKCLAYYKELGEEFYQNLVDMLCFDAIIFNEDRHFGNFGVLRSSRTGQILRTAPLFDNGCSLFCYAMKSDFSDIESYARQRTNPYGIDYVALCRKHMGPRQKKMLRRMINFSFSESDLSNMPVWRLRAIEEMIQRRLHELLM